MLLFRYSYCVGICLLNHPNACKNLFVGNKHILLAVSDICQLEFLLFQKYCDRLFCCFSHQPNEIGISQKIHNWCITHNERGVRWRDSHQLLEVVLHRVGINHHTNGYQRVKGKVEDLVAEEWNDPSCMLLRGTDGGGKRRHMVSYKV